MLTTVARALFGEMKVKAASGFDPNMNEQRVVKKVRTEGESKPVESRVCFGRDALRSVRGPGPEQALESPHRFVVLSARHSLLFLGLIILI
jgi:hypothetical protein